MRVLRSDKLVLHRKASNLASFSQCQITSEFKRIERMPIESDYFATFSSDVSIFLV